MRLADAVTHPVGQVVFALVMTLAVAGLWFALGDPFIVAGLCLAPVVVMIAVRDPFPLCLGFIIFSFFRIHEAYPFLEPFKIPKMLALGTISVLGLHFFFRRIKPYWRPELKWLCWFFAHTTVSMFLSAGRPQAIAYWTDTFVKIFIMVFAIAWLTTTPKRFSLAAAGFTLAGIATSIVAISNALQGIGLVEGSRVTIGRENGSVLGDPNDLSLVLLFPLAFAVTLICTKGVGFLNRALGVIGFAVMVWAILCTQSRGGLLGIMAIMGLFGLRVIKSKVVLMSIGGIGAIGLFAAAGISGRSSGGAGEAGMVDESAQGRFNAWECAFWMAVDHPLWGVGIENFRLNYYTYSSMLGTFEGIAKAVHSTWFAALSEGGFVGFWLFMMVTVSTVKASFKVLKRMDMAVAKGMAVPPAAFAMAAAMPAGMLSFIASGSFLTQAFTWPLYINVALTVAVAHYATTLGIDVDGQTPEQVKAGGLMVLLGLKARPA
ncbi:MAG: O-antigen ligase family protein [Paracraurococcus sp.]